MAEVEKMGRNQAQCWQCREVVYKGIKTCPKCGAINPAANIARLRKVMPILLRVGVPVGIVSLIAGFIMFVKGAEGMMYDIIKGRVPFFLMGGMEIACLLIVIGVTGVVIVPLGYFKLKKIDQQHTAMREDQ